MHPLSLRLLWASAAAALIAGCAAPPPEPAGAPQEAAPAPPAHGIPLLTAPPSRAEPALRIKPERGPAEASGPPGLRLPPEPETAEPPVLLGSGQASWYADSLHGRRTANGERYDREELTAAHRSLPFGARLCVRSLVNGRTVMVRINDRGPFVRGRVIDLSRAAAEELGMVGLGIKPVQLWRLDEGSDNCPEDLETQVEGSSLGLDAAAADEALQLAPPTKAAKPAKAVQKPKARRKPRKR
ncbi:septal ring lytic transglycosylase RlpA family protein [Pulveribacter sp.]|uniref:septal ring lytic transglycosylase RlpA family protein n=1 Tax=Pulveribacter sp. TaxID=2678893 RepID=UPI0028AEE36B|nr:septal ring lytic transglycosylase RlpA family protein [Pulveribacter sp.]